MKSKKPSKTLREFAEIMLSIELYNMKRRCPKSLPEAVENLIVQKYFVFIFPLINWRQGRP